MICKYFNELVQKKINIIKSIVRKIAILMIKRQVHEELQRRNKNRTHLQSRLVEQQSSVECLNKSGFKLRFIQWLKQLPLDQRYLALKVSAKGLAKKVQEALIDFEETTGQQSRKQQLTVKKITPRQTKQIIESIVLISDGEDFFDNVGFDFSYIEHPDKLYELLTITLSQQQKLPYLKEEYEIQSSELKEIYAIVEKCTSKQQLVSCLISFLRTQIFLKFQEKKPINLEEERNRKKEFSMYWRNLSEQHKRKILLLNKEDYSSLSTYLTERKIYLSVQDLEKEINELFQMEKNEFCNKIFKCKLKKSLTYFTDYHELLYKMWKSQLNRKKKRARNHRNNSEKPSNSLNRNLIQANQKPTKRTNNNNENEKQHQKMEFIVQKEKTKNNTQSSNGQQQKTSRNPVTQNIHQQNQKTPKPSNQLTSNQQTQKTQSNKKVSNNVLLSVPQISEGAINMPQKRKRNRNNRRKKSVSAESKQTNTTSNKFQKEENMVFERKIEEQTSIISHEVIETLQQTALIKESQISLLITESTVDGKAFTQLQQSTETISIPQTVIIPQQARQCVYPQIDFSQQISSKIKSDIQQYSDLINQQANQFYQRRVMAYERIQFILGMWKIPIKLFGSCASGITIKNSDIDIAVDNSILNYFMHLAESTRLRGALEQLEQLLQQQPWVTGLKLIKTAAIPLIKMKVNTSIEFIQIPGFDIFPSYIQVLNREHASAGEIHIDLTIETINKELQCNHLGIISTDQINSWLKSIKSLHSIVIIIKNYLTKTNLNITYEGGLNTYSMMCMIVAFIKDNKLEEETDVVKVIEKMLRFYVFQFDQKEKGIDILNQQQIFYDKLALKLTKSAQSQVEHKLPELNHFISTPAFCQADLEIKDPLNDGKIMTKNCYSFPKIKQIFQKIYYTCFIQQQTALQNTFKEKFKAQYLQGQLNLEQNSQEVRQLLYQCRDKLSNPFLTLFE